MAEEYRVLHLRLTRAGLDAIEQAAELEGLSTSAFVTRAALRAAGPVIARADRTVLPAATFNALMASLDTPDEAPRLERGFAKHVV